MSEREYLEGLRYEDKFGSEPEARVVEAICGFCGRNPAEGFATINDRRYCHGDWYPTCYMLASWRDAETLDLHLRPETDVFTRERRSSRDLPDSPAARPEEEK